MNKTIPFLALIGFVNISLPFLLLLTITSISFGMEKKNYTNEEAIKIRLIYNEDKIKYYNSLSHEEFKKKAVLNTNELMTYAHFRDDKYKEELQKLVKDQVRQEVMFKVRTKIQNFTILFTALFSGATLIAGDRILYNSVFHSNKKIDLFLKIIMHTSSSFGVGFLVSLIGHHISSCFE